MGGKRCPDCGEVKPESAYRKNASRPDGLAFYCTQCFKRRDAEGYRRRRERQGFTVREKVAVPPGHKHCPGCGEIKPHSEWGRNRSQKDGLNSYCKSCRSDMCSRDYFKRAYGIDKQELSELRLSQRGLCAICKTRPARHVDHDHRTGQIRGMLCFPCNAGLGHFMDQPEWLRGAARYLERRRHARVPGEDAPCRCSLTAVPGRVRVRRLCGEHAPVHTVVRPQLIGWGPAKPHRRREAE